MGTDVPFPADYGSGERRELPLRGPGQSSGRKRILAYFEGHMQNAPFCTCMAKSKGDNFH